MQGNHKKGNPNWKAPRKSGKSRKRGKQVEYRGISHEQICVSTAMDRNGALVIVPACNGRLTIKALSGLYEGKIEPNSTICTDSHSAYKKFAAAVPAELIQIEKGQHKKGIYHINNINSVTTKSRFGLDHSTELPLSIWGTTCIGLIGVNKTAGLTVPKRVRGCF